MTATIVTRVTKTPPPPAAPRAPRPVAVLDDILLELVDVGSNIRVDAGELAELAASIVTVGLQSPIKVTRQADGRYRLVYGQRRVLASRQAGLTRILALVEPPSDVDEAGARRSIEQLVENLQRADLNPIDEAIALRAVLDADPTLTQDALADQLGRSRPWVSKALGLLEAAPKVQELVRAGQLTPSHVTALRGLAPTTQVELAKEAVTRGRSAHGLEEAVQDHKRSEEWRKERQQAEEKTKRQALERGVASVERLAAKNVPLDAEIRVMGYYHNNEAAAAIRKAGYTNVKTSGEVSPRASATACDCTAWKVETKYDGGFSVSPGCIVPAHVAAKSRLSSHLDDERRKLAASSRKALEARLLEECRGLPRMLARVVLWKTLDWDVNDWVKAHKPAGKRPDAWAELTALTDDELASEVAKYLAKRFQDQNGIKLDWTAIAAELGLADETTAAKPKPAKPLTDTVTAEQEPITDFRRDVEAS